MPKFGITINLATYICTYSWVIMSKKFGITINLATYICAYSWVIMPKFGITINLATYICTYSWVIMSKKFGITINLATYICAYSWVIMPKFWYHHQPSDLHFDCALRQNTSNLPKQGLTQLMLGDYPTNVGLRKMRFYSKITHFTPKY